MTYPFPTPDGDEEELNQQIAGYLHYSLQIDTSLINILHDDIPLRFSDQATLVGHQYSPLPRYTDNGPNRAIDWVIRDQNKLVGYESKYGDSLTKKQLQDELAKLRVNAGDGDVYLVAVTPDITEPSIVDEFEDLYWVSWNTFAKRIHSIDSEDVSVGQRPIIKMLQDLFHAEGMEAFTGFSHEDKRQYTYFVRELGQALDATSLELRRNLPRHTSGILDPNPDNRLVHKYLDIPVFRESRPARQNHLDDCSYFSVIIDLESNEVYAGVTLNIGHVPGHASIVEDYRDKLVGMSVEQNFALWLSKSSINNWSTPPIQTNDADQIQEWLSQTESGSIIVSETRYNRVMFLRECQANTPENTLNSVVEALTETSDWLLSGTDQILPESSLCYIE